MEEFSSTIMEAYTLSELHFLPSPMNRVHVMGWWHCTAAGGKNQFIL
jgi:hypothetical protein